MNGVSITGAALAGLGSLVLLILFIAWFANVNVNIKFMFLGIPLILIGCIMFMFGG